MLGYMHSTLDAMESRLKAEAFKQRVLMCLRAWRDWNVYPADFLGHLQNVFLGLAQSVRSPVGVLDSVFTPDSAYCGRHSRSCTSFQ